jgi:hypothetical protein
MHFLLFFEHFYITWLRRVLSHKGLEKKIEDKLGEEDHIPVVVFDSGIVLVFSSWLKHLLDPVLSLI